MNRVVFWSLLAAGCAGILLSFARARSRAVLAQDGFQEPGRRAAAMTLLGAVLLLTVAIPFAGGFAGGQPDTAKLTLVSLFGVHVLLALFLACYFVLSRRRPLSEFLKIRSARPVADFSSGLLIGMAGWLLMVFLVFLVAAFWWLFRGGTAPTGGVSPTVTWIFQQPLGIRVAVVVSAMVVEELFFRSFLQTRVGPLAATLMFTAAHGVYGQPVLLIGIFAISAVLSLTFAVYGNVLPCIAAHGTFDAIQMFVIPELLRAMGVGGT